MRGILAALFFCLLAALPAQARSAQHAALGADEYYSGPAAMPVYRYEQTVKKIPLHATTARRIDRTRSTSHPVAHQEARGKVNSPLDHVGRGLVTVATAAGEAITVSASFAPKILGFIADLVDSGYVPKDIGCYARGGHMRGSRHYSGNACDFDQLARNKTAKAMYHVGLLAAKWGVRDGCSFRGSPDCGHIDDGHDGYGGRVRYAHHWRHRHYYAGA